MLDFRKLRSAISTNDGKVLLENFLSLSTLQLVGMILPLITLPYILRVIGFEKYGIIIMSTSLIAYFQSLTDYSFRLTATREVAVNRDNVNELSEIFSKVLVVKVIFFLISSITILLLISTIPIFQQNKSIYLLSSLMLLGYVIFPEWFFQGMERMKYITFLNIGIKVFFTIMIFFCIKSEKDFWIYPLLQALGLIGAGIIGLYIVIKKYRISFSMPSFKVIWITIKGNFPIFVNQFIPTLYNNTSIFLLGILTNNISVGIYNAILTIVSLIVTLIEILSRVFFPFLNRNKDKFPKYLKLCISFSSVLIVGTLIFHKLIFWYLDIQSQNAFLILFILCVGVIGYTLYNIFGTNYFIVHNRDSLVMWNTIITSIIGLIIVGPLISYYGIIGAALTLTICRLLLGGGLMYTYLKTNKFNT